MIYLIILISLARINLVHLQGELVVFDNQPAKVNMKEVYKYRCTRRYTPGNCIKEVNPVWTFEFQIQNCTERIGCLHTVRSNRFDSYNSCMKRCRRLIELYAKILSYQQQDHDGALREGTDMSARRELAESDTPSDYVYQEYGQEQDTEVFKYMYRDFERTSDDRRPVNVDYVARGAYYIDEA